MAAPLALPENAHSPLRARVALVTAAVVGALVVVALWGPVARGLHEQSVRRWCVQSAGHASTVSVAVEEIGQIEYCVEQALSDPGFTAALRARL